MMSHVAATISRRAITGMGPSELEIDPAAVRDRPLVACVVDAFESERPEPGLIVQHARVLDVGRDLQADAIRERREKSAAEAVLNDVRIAVKRHAVRDEVRRAGEIRADLLNADEADGCLAEWPEAALPIGVLAVPEVESPALIVAELRAERLIDQQTNRREVGL